MWLLPCWLSLGKDRIGQMSGRGVIVTGIGIICALGEQKETFWNELSQGKCGLGEVDLFEVSGYRSRMGGQVRNVDFLTRLSLHECRRLGRCDQLGLWAAQEALREAKIMERNLSPDRVAVVMGAGAGGVFEAEQYRRQLYEGRILPRPSLLMPFPACNLTDAIGNLYGFSGVRSTIATACSSSATAMLREVPSLSRSSLFPASMHFVLWIGGLADLLIEIGRD